MPSSHNGQPSYSVPNQSSISEKSATLSESSSNAVQGLVVINNLHQIIGWNLSASYISGYSRDKMIGSSILDLIPNEEEKKGFVADFNQLSCQCEKLDLYHESQVNILTSLGETKKVTLEWNRMILVGVHVFNICIKDFIMNGDSLDVFKAKEEELARKEKELAKLTSSNQQLESFAYVASHDLKEPLRSIGNFTQLLAKRLDGKLDETDQEFFGFVTNGVKNMNNLIEDLLTYSRVNSSKHEVVEIDPKDSLSVVINGLNQRIIETDAQIEIKELPSKILGNPTKIKQLFQNLIANSIKFQNPDLTPKITISGIESQNMWTFKISDNGIGIQEEFYKKVFGIFTKLHHKSVYPGSGIGLSVCQRIVEQHDGEIWVDSVFGAGTNIHFTIAKNQGFC